MILATKRQTSGFGAEPQFKKRSFPPVRRAIWQDLPGLVDLALFPWLTPWAIGFRPDGLTHPDFHFYVAHPMILLAWRPSALPRAPAVPWGYETQ